MNIEKSISSWKALAHLKSIKPRHVVERAILIAMTKSDNFEEQVSIAKQIIYKAFKPMTSKKHLNANLNLDSKLWPYKAVDMALHSINKNNILNAKEPILDSFEYEIFKNIVTFLQEKKVPDTYYSYIFVRDDLIPEQCVVQAAHAALKLGHVLTENNAWPDGVTPDNLHYTIVKWSIFNIVHLRHTLSSNGIKYVDYVDNDYRFVNDQLTETNSKQVRAIMTYPIHWSEKAPLRDFKLLRFKIANEVVVG